MKYWLAVFCLLLQSCVGTTAKLNKVSLGMTKAEVVQQIGRADSVSAVGNEEYLIYYWATPKQVFADENNLPEYFVKLVDGKVAAYGKKGDFGTTAPETQKHIIEATIKT